MRIETSQEHTSDIPAKLHGGKPEDLSSLSRPILHVLQQQNTPRHWIPLPACTGVHSHTLILLSICCKDLLSLTERLPTSSQKQ